MATMCALVAMTRLLVTASYEPGSPDASVEGRQAVAATPLARVAVAMRVRFVRAATHGDGGERWQLAWWLVVM